MQYRCICHEMDVHAFRYTINVHDVLYMYNTLLLNISAESLFDHDLTLQWWSDTNMIGVTEWQKCQFQPWFIANTCSENPDRSGWHQLRCLGRLLIVPIRDTEYLHRTRNNSQGQTQVWMSKPSAPQKRWTKQMYLEWEEPSPPYTSERPKYSPSKCIIHIADMNL